MWPCIRSGNVLAPMFYALLCASFAIKSCDYGQHFRFCYKTRRKATDKTLEPRFLKEFKATRKLSSGESI